MLNTSHLTDSLYDNTYHSLTGVDFDIIADFDTSGFDTSCFDAKSALAFASLPLIIQEQMLQSKRIVLIANNPSIDTASLEAPTDMLVLFNDFIHADFFAHHPSAKDLPKLLFFRKNGDSLLHFGMPPRSNNLTAMLDMAKSMHHLAFCLGILTTSFHYQATTLDPMMTR